MGIRAVLGGVLCVVWSLGAVAVGGEKERSFTSSDGKGLSATLLDLEDGAAKLLLKNGRTTLVPLTRLSEEDQVYVKSWAERYKSTLPMGALRAVIDKSEKFERPEKEDKKKEDKDKKKIRRTTKTSYSMKIDNATNEAIEGVEVYLRVFKTVNRNGGRTEVEEAGVEKWAVGDLEAKGTADTETGTFVAVDWTEGSTRQSEKTFGVLADVVVGGVFYQRFSYPSNTDSYVRENFKMRGEEFKEPDYGAKDAVKAVEAVEEEVD